MIKYLNKEQSKELIELGISSDKASLVSWKSTQDWQGNSVLNKEHITTKPFRPAVMGFENFDCQDIFTLTDIISILPEATRDLGGIIFGFSVERGTWVAYYDDCLNSHQYGEELIIVLFNLLKYIIKNYGTKCL